MSDQELWAALNVLARRFGLVPDGKRVALVDDEPPVELCRRRSEPDKYGIVLECSKPRGHFENECSWTSAFVGIAACQARAKIVAGHEPWRCEFRGGHEGVHGRTDTNGVVWTWAPGATPVAHTSVCSEVAPDGTVSCALDAGHELPHRSALRNMSYDTWPVSAARHEPVGKALLTPSGHLPCPPSRSGSGSGAPCALNAGHAGDCSAVRDEPQRCRNASLATVAGERPARRCPRPAGHERANAGGCGPFLVEGGEEWNAYRDDPTIGRA